MMWEKSMTTVKTLMEKIQPDELAIKFGDITYYTGDGKRAKVDIKGEDILQYYKQHYGNKVFIYFYDNERKAVSIPGAEYDEGREIASFPLEKLDPETCFISTWKLFTEEDDDEQCCEWWYFSPPYVHHLSKTFSDILDDIASMLFFNVPQKESDNDVSNTSSNSDEELTA